MIKKPSLSQTIFLSYFLGVICLRILKRLGFFSLGLLLDNIYFFLGGFFGWFLLKADRLVDAFFTNPQTQLSQKIRDLVKNRNFLELFRTFEKHRFEQKNLAFRNAIFQATWLVLAFFTLSSTSSFFGKGMILGLGLHLLFDEWKDYKSKGISYVRDWLFWQIKRKVSLQEARVFLWVMIGGFVFLTFLII